MAYRTGWPVMPQLQDDPYLRKGTSDAQRMDFNRRLYRPGTAQIGPTPPSTPPAGTPTVNLGGGFMSGVPSVTSPYQTPGTFAGYSGAPPTMGGFPVSPTGGVAGPAGPASAGPPDPLSTDPSAFPPPSGDTENAFPHTASIGQPTSGNAMQRHQDEAAKPPEMRPISSARRFFWGTGLIDARAPHSAADAPTNFDATFGAGATHMGTPGTTWEQRQQQNQQHIADATAQRGLDWSAY